MIIESTTSKDLKIVDDRVKYDAACKRLLSEKVILAWIMKSCLEEYRDSDIDDIVNKYIENEPQVGNIPVAPDEIAFYEKSKSTKVRQMATEDKSVNEGTINYDIRFFATAPDSCEKIRLIINVEAQNKFHPGYPLLKRGIYYASRMISSQYGTEFIEPEYGKIKKVYSIWICMNPPKSRNNSITKYCIKEENFVGSVKENIKNYDLMTIIMICLGDSNSKNYDGILKLLNVLFSTEIKQTEKKEILKNDFNIKMTQELESEVSLMCNLSEGVFEKAMLEGMEKGMEKGILEGVLSSIKSLMESMGWSANQAMTALKIPETEQSKYIELLK